MSTCSSTPATAKSVLAMTKVGTRATAAELTAVHRYALASFLLGTDGHQYFFFDSDGAGGAVADDTPDDHVDVGSPSGAYARVAGGAAHVGLHRRRRRGQPDGGQRRHPARGHLQEPRRCHQLVGDHAALQRRRLHPADGLGHQPGPAPHGLGHVEAHDQTDGDEHPDRATCAADLAETGDRRVRTV